MFSLSCVSIPSNGPSVSELLSSICVLWVNLDPVVPLCSPKIWLTGFPQFVLFKIFIILFLINFFYSFTF